jgi:hypothetical protein
MNRRKFLRMIGSAVALQAVKPIKQGLGVLDAALSHYDYNPELDFVIDEEIFDSAISLGETYSAGNYAMGVQVIVNQKLLWSSIKAKDQYGNVFYTEDGKNWMCDQEGILPEFLCAS